MRANVKHVPRDDEFSEEEADTVRLPLSGKWIVACDRGARRLDAVIGALESGAEPENLIDTLREISALVQGRGEP